MEPEAAPASLAPALQPHPAPYAVAARAQAAHAARTKDLQPKAEVDLLDALQDRLNGGKLAPRHRLRMAAIGHELEKARAELDDLSSGMVSTSLIDSQVLHPFTELPSEAQGFHGMDSFASNLRNMPDVLASDARSKASEAAREATRIKVGILEEKLTFELACSVTGTPSIYSPGRVSRTTSGAKKGSARPTLIDVDSGPATSLAVSPAIMAHASTAGRACGDVISRLPQQRRYLRQMYKRTGHTYAESLKSAVGDREITNHKGEKVQVKKRFKTLPANFGEQDHAIRGAEAEEKRLAALVGNTNQSNIDVAPPPVVQVGALPAAWSEAAGSVPLGTRSTVTNWAASEFEATRNLAVEMASQWPTENKLMTSMAWRRDARVGKWAAATQSSQREQFERIAQILLHGINAGPNQPRPQNRGEDSALRSSWPAPLQLIALWAREALDKAQSTAEIDAVGTMLQTASVQLTQMELKTLVEKEESVAAQQYHNASIRAKLHKKQGDHALYEVFKKQKEVARIRLRHAPGAAAAASIGGRRGVGHGQWADMQVMEALARRFDRLCSDPGQFDRALVNQVNPGRGLLNVLNKKDMLIQEAKAANKAETAERERWKESNAGLAAISALQTQPQPEPEPEQEPEQQLEPEPEPETGPQTAPVLEPEQDESDSAENDEKLAAEAAKKRREGRLNAKATATAAGESPKPAEFDWGTMMPVPLPPMKPPDPSSLPSPPELVALLSEAEMKRVKMEQALIRAVLRDHANWPLQPKVMSEMLTIQRLAAHAVERILGTDSFRRTAQSLWQAPKYSPPVLMSPVGGKSSAYTADAGSAEEKRDPVRGRPPVHVPAPPRSPRPSAVQQQWKPARSTRPTPGSLSHVGVALSVANPTAAPGQKKAAKATATDEPGDYPFGWEHVNQLMLLLGPQDKTEVDVLFSLMPEAETEGGGASTLSLSPDELMRELAKTLEVDVRRLEVMVTQSTKEESPRSRSPQRGKSQNSRTGCGRTRPSRPGDDVQPRCQA